ncbi:hypothetical protein V9T40_009868 [Parthenolecanium corni]|uniref:Uncharacterized protein n=1 Tax=Parthenolecanium corni TaxID=536013 RepID=A0AAN9TQ30_9HEMI
MIENRNGLTTDKILILRIIFSFFAHRVRAYTRSRSCHSHPVFFSPSLRVASPQLTPRSHAKSRSPWRGVASSRLGYRRLKSGKKPPAAAAVAVSPPSTLNVDSRYRMPKAAPAVSIARSHSSLLSSLFSLLGRIRRRGRNRVITIISRKIGQRPAASPKKTAEPTNATIRYDTMR